MYSGRNINLILLGKRLRRTETYNNVQQLEIEDNQQSQAVSIQQLTNTVSAAQTQLNQVSTTANTAQTTATNAQTIAQAAQLTATNAQSIANNLTTSVEQATGLAGNAIVAAQQATEAAENAETIANQSVTALNTVNQSVIGLTTQVNNLPAQVTAQVTTQVEQAITELNNNSQAFIAQIQADILTNAENITNISTNVADITTSLQTANNQIQTVSDQLVITDANTNTNTSSISTLNANLTSLTASVATNTSNIATHTLDINAINTRPLDQFTAPTGNLSMANRKIMNIAFPTNNKDAATKEYIDTEIAALIIPWVKTTYLYATDIPGTSGLYNGWTITGFAVTVSNLAVNVGVSITQRLFEITVPDQGFDIMPIFQEGGKMNSGYHVSSFNDGAVPPTICLSVPGGDSWGATGSNTINGTGTVPQPGYSTNWRTKFLFWVQDKYVMPYSIQILWTKK